MFKKVSTLIASLALAASVTAVSLDSAEARSRHRGAVVGGVALGVLALGALSARGDSYARGGCYRGPSECRWVGGGCFYNRFGDYVCGRGRRECSRQTYCD